METKRCCSRAVYRCVLFAVTFLSFWAILHFLLFFAFAAPSFYEPEVRKRVMDVLFALLLLANNVCAILSLVEFVKVCREICQNRRFLKTQLLSLFAGIYPALVILLITGGRLPVLTQYLLSPFRILFGR